jgi:hypothetical protein
MNLALEMMRRPLVLLVLFVSDDIIRLSENVKEIMKYDNQYFVFQFKIFSNKFVSPFRENKIKTI